MALTQERVGKGSVPLDDASHALHFALLAGTDGGLDDPAKVVGKIERIGTQDKGLQDKLVADKNAASYTAPCAKAFPETQAGDEFVLQSLEIGRAQSELQSLMRISYAVFCLQKKTKKKT